jgi:hypothetical protein
MLVVTSDSVIATDPISLGRPALRAKFCWPRASTTSGQCSMRSICWPAGQASPRACHSPCAKPVSHNCSPSRSTPSFSPNMRKATSGTRYSASPATWDWRELSRNTSIALMVAAGADTGSRSRTERHPAYNRVRDALGTRYRINR